MIKMVTIEIKNLRNERPTEPYQVRIDRGHSILSNPYYMHSEEERDAVCNKYKDYFYQNVHHNYAFTEALRNLYRIAKKYGKLELFCWCYPKRCHGETIKKFLMKYLEENKNATRN